MKPAKLADYLNDQNDSVLLAWDAPLTRPRDPDKPVVNEQDLTIRTIEKFFRRGGLLKPPEGITPLGYGSCPKGGFAETAHREPTFPRSAPRFFFRANGERMQRYFTYTARGELLFVLLGLF